LLKQLTIERRARGVGIGNNLPLGESDHQLFWQTPLQDPTKRHGHDMVIVDVVESDYLMRHSGPKSANPTGVDGDSLAAD
jgi:hypothetical protein